MATVEPCQEAVEPGLRVERRIGSAHLTKLLLLALLLVGLLGVPAQAAIIHEPLSGITVAWGGSVYFDWAWECGDFRCEWSSGLVFTRTSDPDDPIWFGSFDRGQVYTGQFYDSHATVWFDDTYGFTAGDWYWRLCSKTLEGEDDKCYYDSNPPRKVTVLPPPPPPPPPPLPPPAACNDGKDNDGDGLIDAGEDPECTSETDGSEATIKLRGAEAKRLTKRVLRREFRRAWTKRVYARVGSCQRRSYMSVACKVLWTLPARTHGAKAEYRGKVVVRFISEGGRIKRAGYRLSILKWNILADRKRRIRRRGSFRYTPDVSTAASRSRDAADR